MQTDRESQNLITEIAEVTGWIHKQLSQYPEDADEISNDVLSVMHEKIKSDEKIKSKSSYAFIVARNKIAKFHSKRNYSKSRLKVYFASLPDTDYSEHSSFKIEGLEAIELINNLPYPSKEIILKRVESELTFKEIGELFDRSESWAFEEFQKATKLLNKNLGS